MAFMALFLFDCAFLERFTTDGQAYVLVQRDGSCGEQGHSAWLQRSRGELKGEQGLGVMAVR
ncbi:unnamed protein product [Cladocopium goreaui]|uniref:Uncharacterized protein n=1 Tax=Cladocopium goreaui TaxID=2562237 RepID=A0A9P1D553_9DINO|nr:unnamed protein product [Cladocopium goreaui]